MTGEIIVRILVAAGLGIVVGVEREVAGQPAGLRTHLTVALGACLFGVVSTLGFSEYVQRRELTNVQVDVTRVASQVVVGIGFLGAGIIFRQGPHVRNLTTAATLWVTSAVGLAAGVGAHVAALVTTVALVAGLALLRPVRQLIVEAFVHDRRRVTITLRPGAPVEPVIEALRTASAAVAVHDVRLGRDGEHLVLHAELRAAARHRCHEATDPLVHRADVHGLETSARG